MIKCICINDKGRPKSIAPDKWIKKEQEYTIVFASFLKPQNELGLQLKEVDLDDSCFPYEYFLANRFAFYKEDFNKLIEFIKDCGEMNVSVNELIKQTKVIYEK